MALAARDKAQSQAQDKYTLKALNGVAFSEFKGYETWQTVSVSRTDNDIKAILANPVMIRAFEEGAPGNGKPFPEGSKIVKIEWKKTPNPLSPYAVEIPDTLDASRSSKRIPRDSRKRVDGDMRSLTTMRRPATSLSTERTPRLAIFVTRATRS
jgi:hypothetical protein